MQELIKPIALAFSYTHTLEASSKMPPEPVSRHWRQMLIQKNLCRSRKSCSLRRKVLSVLLQGVDRSVREVHSPELNIFQPDVEA